MNFNPTMIVPVLEPTRLASVTLETAGADPLLDEQGNPILDENGGIIYGD